MHSKNFIMERLTRSPSIALSVRGYSAITAHKIAINLNLRRNKEKLNDLHEFIASVGLSSLVATCVRGPLQTKVRHARHQTF